MSGRWNQSGVACEVRSGTSDRCCAAGGSRGSLSERSRLKIEREGRGDWGRQFATVAGLLAAVYRDGRWLYSCSRLNQDLHGLLLSPSHLKATARTVREVGLHLVQDERVQAT